MRMNKVIFQPKAFHELHQATGKGDHLRGKVFLIKALIRAGHDIDNPEALFNLDDFPLARPGSTGKDIDLYSLLSQLPRDIKNVDIHAAGIAGTGLLDRGSMQRNHRDAHIHTV